MEGRGYNRRNKKYAYINHSRDVREDRVNMYLIYIYIYVWRGRIIYRWNCSIARCSVYLLTRKSKSWWITLRIISYIVRSYMMLELWCTERSIRNTSRPLTFSSVPFYRVVTRRAEWITWQSLLPGSLSRRNSKTGKIHPGRKNNLGELRESGRITEESNTSSQMISPDWRNYQKKTQRKRKRN